MGTICAWCENVMPAAGPSAAAGPAHGAASHGICPGCLAERLAAIRGTPPSGSSSRSAPLRAAA